MEIAEFRFKMDIIAVVESLFDTSINFYEVQTEKTRIPELGDLTTAISLKCAGLFKRKPMEIAVEVSETLKQFGHYADINISGPGYINVRLQQRSISILNQETVKENIERLMENATMSEEFIMDLIKDFKRINNIIRVFRDDNIQENQSTDGVAKEIIVFWGLLESFLYSYDGELNALYYQCMAETLQRLSELFKSIDTTVVYRKYSPAEAGVVLSIYSFISVIFEAVIKKC